MGIVNQGQPAQEENLKRILEGFGIKTAKELDAALSDALSVLTIGIMTEELAEVRNTA